MLKKLIALLFLQAITTIASEREKSSAHHPLRGRSTAAAAPAASPKSQVRNAHEKEATLLLQQLDVMSEKAKREVRLQLSINQEMGKLRIFETWIMRLAGKNRQEVIKSLAENDVSRAILQEILQNFKKPSKKASINPKTEEVFDYETSPTRPVTAREERSEKSAKKEELAAQAEATYIVEKLVNLSVAEITQIVNFLERLQRGASNGFKGWLELIETEGEDCIIERLAKQPAAREPLRQLLLTVADIVPSLHDVDFNFD